tara:strand:+ start:9617 stop:9814 length:198 start_codon:yes stop_codon:yes gene_type:complete
MYPNRRNENRYSQRGGEMSSQLKTGLIVGGVALGLLIIFLIFFFVMRRRDSGMVTLDGFGRPMYN